MKRFSALMAAALLLSFTFGGCKKDSKKPATTTTTQSMKLTLNGTAKSYNTCFASDATVGNQKQILISGYNVTNGQTTDDTFEVDIMHDISALTVGETFPASASFEQANTVGFYYSPDDNDSFSSQPAQAQGTCTITAVTSTTISGTFSGQLYNVDDLNGTTLKYTVTNGSFTAVKPK